MSAKSVVMSLLVVALIVLLAFGLIDKNENAIAIGDPVPEPELTELASGDDAALDRYRGEWLLVNVWSSWCGPCRTESPDLLAFQEAHRDQLVVVGVNIEDALDHAKGFVDEFGLTYPQLRAKNNDDVIDAFGVIGRPESYLIDPEGRIALINRGPLNEKLLAERVEPVLEAES